MSEALRLGEMYGWVGVDRHSSDIAALKERLIRQNGLVGLEAFEPNEIEDAKRVFYRDGFVLVKNALTSDQLSEAQKGSYRVISEIMALDAKRDGNRGSHRYSFGAASTSGHQVHNSEWAMLIDLPTVTPILEAIFESPDYICRGGGGDFCLPGATQYQPLHSDVGDRRPKTTHAAAADSDSSKFSGSFWDPRGLMTLRDLPCPYVCCNYLVTDFTAINGATRQIPGTQNSREAIPTLEDEPEWMTFSTVNPAPAGSLLIRDPRTWHGGTPNVSNEVRAIPNIEYYAPWFHEPMARSMPLDIYNSLSDHGKNICRYIVSSSEIDTAIRTNLGGTPHLLQTT